MKAKHYEMTVEVDEEFVNIIVGARNKTDAIKELKKELKRRKIELYEAFDRTAVYEILL